MTSSLVGVHADLAHGLHQLRLLAKIFAEDHHIEGISSIYEVALVNDLWRESGVEDYGYAVVFRLATEYSVDLFLDYLIDYEKEILRDATRNFLQIYLLTYGQSVEMTRRINLPHPEFHLKPQLLVPAREVWGDYQHPILKKSLAGLAEPFVNVDWGKYYAQGRSLFHRGPGET